MTVPAHPKIYHIVHIDNLASIVADGHLWSDASMLGRSGTTVIGMGSIKRRRLTLPVSCHHGLCVGNCVPFYLCSRSIMLYVIHQANHVDLAYRGGQQPILHLEADLRAAIDWSHQNERRWAVSLSNAAASYAHFGSQLQDLHEIDWEAVAATAWSAPEIKEAKQAEFLVEHSFPWHLVERIGIQSPAIAPRVAAALAGATHKPRVEVQPRWYY